MQRQIKSYAIILRGSRFSEIHKNISFLTPDFSVIRAFAHGALKIGSRFGGRTELYSLVNLELYYSPTKEVYSIREIEVINYFSGIREDSLRYFAISMWAELILKTEAWGESKKVFNLLVNALFYLNGANSNQISLLNLQFLLRYLAFGGFFPDFTTCNSCEKKFRQEMTSFLDIIEGVSYCSDCMKGTHSLVSSIQREYIVTTMSLKLADALDIEITDNQLKPLYNMVVKYIKEQAGVRIRSFEMLLGKKQYAMD